MAEKIKIEIGSAYITDENRRKSLEIRGRDSYSGLPKRLPLLPLMCMKHCRKTIIEIVDAVKNCLEMLAGIILRYYG
jgi:rod shape-determining protein MreB